jgi:hypothetical protein
MPAVPVLPPPGEDDGFDRAVYLDPDSGYPDGDDAWLADLAAPAADQILAEQAAAAGVGAPEAFGAGFTHRGPGAAGGRGFASGGPLDTLEPGPVLGVFLARARAGGMPALTEDEVVGVMCAAERQASYDASVKLDAVTDLNRRRTATAEATGDHRALDHVGDEVAMALTLTGRAAARLMDLAAGTARLPAVRTALVAGRIDVLRAEVFADELAGLDDITAAAVAAVVIRDAENLTTGQLRVVLRRAVLGIDPAAARKRREKAQKDARVETWSELAGTAALAGRDLPPAEVLAADRQLSADASALKAAGASGSLQYLRARVYLARLSGQPLHTLLRAPPDNATPGHSEPGYGPDGPGDSGDPDGPDEPDGSGDPDGPGDPGNGGGPRRGPSGANPGPSAGGGLFPAGLKGSVNLTAPLATLLGWSGQPGDVAGYGPIDAAATRDLATALAATPGNLWCVTLTDLDGYPVAHGCTTASPGPPPQPPRPPPQPPGPSGPAPPRSGAGPPRDTQAGEPSCAELPGEAGAWLSGIDIQPLATGVCDHQREGSGYRPSAALRHLIQIRDITCSHRTCRRPATQCDLDHTVPYDQGGRTCECNLGTPCRRHHQAKQAPGWKLDQPQPGRYTWTTPSGRTYTTRPGRYPT